MYRLLAIAIMTAAVTLMSGGRVLAEANNSANSIMPGCRQTASHFERGYCLGVLSGLAAVPNVFCQPDGATAGQKRSVVIAYIDARPARLHEDFRALALEALKAAWPCRPGVR